VSGIDAAAEAAAREGVTLIPGIELSAQVGGESVHILGYGVDPADPELRRYADTVKEARVHRCRTMIERLNAAGVDVSFSDVERHAAGVITRSHLAQALVDRGAAVDGQDAFARLIGDGSDAYVNSWEIEARDAIQLIRSAGGVSILAHPGEWTSHDVVRLLIQTGIDGLEIRHPSHDDRLEAYYASLVDAAGMLSSGGSDFHGRYELETDRIGRYSPAEHRLAALRERLSL
jgi:predicted metal-dependent phosphoesterase TrpH